MAEAPTSNSNRSEAMTAVVTGGAHGIGLALVTGLATAGWRVFYCTRSPQSLAAAQETLAHFGAQVQGRQTDVRVQSEVEAFAAWTLDATGRIDCLVNNAGVGTFAPVHKLTGDEWREMIETNLSGAFYAVRAVVPSMKERGTGWIINIASLAGRHAFAGGSGYNATKFGLVGFAEAAMLDLREHGIRVVTLLPGSVDTGFRTPGTDSRSWMLAPEDIASMVLHILSYPDRALPSLVEMRPTRPPGH
jgi:3-oxoacyl-[acyl-carrier protein] reductase